MTPEPTPPRSLPDRRSRADVPPRLLSDISEPSGSMGSLALQNTGLLVLLEEARDAMLLLNDDGNCIAANAAACDLLERLPQQLLGHCLNDWVEPQLDLGQLRQCLPQQRLLFRLQLILPNRSDQTPARIAECSFRGNVLPEHHLIVLRSLNESELRFRVAELERLNQLKDDFLSSISHELRTPISNIKLATQLLTMGLQRLGIFEPVEPDGMSAAAANVARYLDVLKGECEREITLINNLLDLNQLDVRSDPPAASLIDLKTWLPHIVKSFEERAQTQQQRLVLEMADQHLTLETDLTDLGRILNELLNNACKYTPSGGTITVATRMVKPRDRKAREKSKDREQPAPIASLEIWVSNSGVEIPVSEHDRIFEKFYRIPSHDPWKHGGTGLGLALVRKLADRLSATVQVQSGAGQTAFVLRFLV